MDSPFSDGDGNYASVQINDTTVGYIEDLKMDVKEVSTDYGRCYTLESKWDLGYHDYYTFYLNLTIPDRYIQRYTDFR